MLVVVFRVGGVVDVQGLSGRLDTDWLVLWVFSPWGEGAGDKKGLGAKPVPEI